jgi:hypothetical protein
MPTLTRYFIKSGLVNFVAALLVAILLQGSLVFELPAFVTYLNPVYFHLFMVGWITQIIMGVSIWMFPPLSKERPRGNILLGWLTFVCLNTGLVMRLVSEPMMTLHPASDWRYALIFSASLQWVAGLFYVIIIWNRIRGK